MSKIPETLKQWEFDPTGTNPSNLVKGEEHYVSELDPENRILSPLYGPFYSITVYDIDGVEVDKSKYVLGDKIPELVGYTDRPLYHNIIFKEKITGNMFVDYQLAGGFLTRIRSDLISWLISHLNDPIKTKWSSVKDIPHIQPAYTHRHHWIDVVNAEGIGLSVDKITSAINKSMGSDSNQIYTTLIGRIKTLVTNIENYKYPEHIANDLAHSVSNDDIGADIKGSEAKAADLFYGATYLTFLIEAEKTSINWKALSDHIKVHNDQSISGDLLVNNEFRWGNLVNDSLSVSGFFRLGGAKGAGIGPNQAKLSVTPTEVTFNGYKVYDWASAMDYAKELDGALLISITSTDFSVSGNGTSVNPIALTLNYPLATENNYGFLRLSATTSNNRDGWGFMSSAAKAMRDNLIMYTPNDLLINGKGAVNGAFTVNKVDIGLPDVDNTSDTAKPVSKAQRKVLEELADAGHEHSWDDINWNTPSEELQGVSKLVTDPNIDGVITTAIGRDYADRVTDLVNGVQTKVQFSDYNMTISSGVVLRNDGVRILIEGGTVTRSFDGNINTYTLNGVASVPFEDNRDKNFVKVYVSHTPPHTFVASSKELYLGDAYALIGYIRAGEVTPSLPQSPIIDYGKDSSLNPHAKDSKPHGLDKPIPELSVVANKGIYTEVSLNKAICLRDGSLYYYDITEFNKLTCNGLAIQSLGSTPLAWKGDVEGDIIYQRSFVCQAGDDNAILDTSAVEHDVIIGMQQLDTFNFLVMRVSPNLMPQLYIEKWNYTIVGSEHKLGGVTRQRIGLVFNTQEGYSNPGSLSNLYRFYYNSNTDEFRWEVVGNKHIIQTGKVAGMLPAVKDNFISLLENPYSGVRSINTSQLAVTGAVRRPHPNSANEVNDYGSLFNSYISAAALDKMRKDNGKYTTRLRVNGYYEKSSDSMVIDSLNSILPNGYNTFSVRLLENPKTTTRVLDEKDLSFKLSMGSIVNVGDWYLGYSGRIRRGDLYKIKFTSPREYDGVVVDTEMEDGDILSIYIEVTSFNILWGVSASDWSYLSKHLATRISDPEQPIINPNYILDGLESKYLE